MVGSTQVRIVQAVTNSIQNDEISLHHKLQREPGQWNKEAKSLLIDSILRDIPINTIYSIVEKVNGGDSTESRLAIIDGIQRISTINDFINDKFAISMNAEKVAGEDIAGKKYSELSTKLKNKILNFQLNFYEITTYTEKEVREIFKRQNNGKQLNKKQMRTAIENDKVLEAIFRLTSHKLLIGSEEEIPVDIENEVAAKATDEASAVENASGEGQEVVKKRGRPRKNDAPKPKKLVWKGLMTPAQVKNAVDRDIILQTLMIILHEQGECDLAFDSDGIDKFIEDYLNSNISKHSKMITNLEIGMDRLYHAFKDKKKVKINATAMPLVLYGAYKRIKDKKSFIDYLENLTKFLDEYDTNEEYKKFSAGHTTSKENVQGRLDYFKANVIPS